MPSLAHARTFTLHLNSARTRGVLLPGGDADARILSELSNHLPESPPPPRATPVATSDWIVGFSAMVLVWVLGVLWSPQAPTHHASAFRQLILPIGFFAGPGTWIAVVLWRRRATSSLVSFALLINAFSILGGMAAAGLASLLRAPR